jgi:RNA polymerase sigma-70 factor (ECF subfamily)
MDLGPATQASLLVRIRDAGDRDAWTRFVDLYAPLVYRYARRQGLQDADAADLTQDVLRAVAGAAGRLQYDPARGTFRGWLFTVVRNKLRDWLDRRRRECVGAGGTTAVDRLHEAAAPEDAAEQWERDHERRLFEWACEQARPDFGEATWRAFRLTAVEGKSGKEAARTLGITVAAVYLAKGRVMKRIKELLHQVQDE